MKEQDILLALEELISNLGIQLRYEKGDFVGGFCRVDGHQVIIVNSHLTMRKKIRLLARELACINLDDVFVVPAVRKLIDKERQCEESLDAFEYMEDTEHD